jgi:hypothetical protein
MEEIFENIKIKYPKAVNYGSYIWFQYYNDNDKLNFEIYDYTTIIVSSEITGINFNKEILEIIKTFDDTIPKFEIPCNAIEILISNLFDSAGFNLTEFEDIETETNEFEDIWFELKKIANPERNILFVSFGEKFKKPSLMETGKISLDIPYSCNKTFDARHINSSKPKGKSLKDLCGTDEIIQKCIQAGSGFSFVMNCIVKSIENNGYKRVGIYCTAGHHRSVAVVELLKKYLYPKAKIKHLHINR